MGPEPRPSVKVAERFGAEWRDPYLTRPFDGARERDRYIDITDPDFWRICAKCVPYTLVSVPRLYDLYRSVRYVCDAAVPGDLVECGVLLGGAVMLMAETLTLCGDRDRRIYLYDTFCGSPRHTAADVDFTGRPFEEWSTADFLPDTRANLALADFPADRYEIIVGPVQDTISRWVLDMACLVRLDTGHLLIDAGRASAALPAACRRGRAECRRLRLLRRLPEACGRSVFSPFPGADPAAPHRLHRPVRHQMLTARHHGGAGPTIRPASGRRALPASAR